MFGYKRKLVWTTNKAVLGRCVTDFNAPIWKIGLCITYHQSKKFTQGKWYLSAIGNVFFEVKKCVENAFYRDLETQIY